MDRPLQVLIYLYVMTHTVITALSADCTIRVDRWVHLNNILFFVLVPIIGYIFLWILGGVFFLTYFRILSLPASLDYTEKIRRVPPYVSITTVPLCSSISFYLTTKLLLELHLSTGSLLVLVETGILALVFTVIIDLIVTPKIEKIEIRAYPMNLMYLLAWTVIIPSVLLAGI